MVEENLSIDKGSINPRVNTQRMAVPDRQISIFANFNRTDSVLDAKLPGGIPGDEL
jgi:hypothetical protein